jgi:chromosome segregation ATPase
MDNKNNDAKKMLLEVLSGEKKKKKAAVYIQDDEDDLESESDEFFDPPVVPKSCNGDKKHIFKPEIEHTVTSQIQDTNSVGSTVSFKTFNLEPPTEYEEIIQKLEADIRRHIRIQNQLKLHIESLQAKVDENEKADDSKDKRIEELEHGTAKFKQIIIELDRKKQDQIKNIKEQSDIEVKKLNEKIQKLNKSLFECSRPENKNTLASAIPHSSIERSKILDSARSNIVSSLNLYI